MKRRLLELVLVTTGLICLSKAGWNMYRYRHFQNQSFSKRLMVATSTPRQNEERGSRHPTILGQLSIPRLEMSAVVVEGDDDQSLSLAVGHMKGTASLGSSGNAVIAGHRDTVFWPLRKIRAGDLIVISTDKRYVYTVEQTRVVEPGDTDALQDSQRGILTMITCYPFRHIGPSPKRFVVTARLVRAQS